MAFDGRHATMEEPDAIHPAAFVGATDPSLDPLNLVTAHKLWIDTTTGPPYTLYKRDAGNTTWELVGASASNPATVPLNLQTGDYTLVLTDAGKCVEINSGAAHNLTIPLNATVAFPVGTTILVRMVGAGVVTIVATGGVTVDVRASLGLNLIDQWSTASLHQRATNEWVLTGEVN